MRILGGHPYVTSFPSSELSSQAGMGRFPPVDVDPRLIMLADRLVIVDRSYDAFDSVHTQHPNRTPSRVKKTFGLYRLSIYDTAHSKAEGGEQARMRKKPLQPVHPGKILREEYMTPLGLSANALARALGVTPARINDIANEKRGITADTALRLARYFGTDAQSWINLQTNHDLECARQELGAALKRIHPRAA
jgi:antitoxin HigA-1